MGALAYCHVEAYSAWYGAQDFDEGTDASSTKVASLTENHDPHDSISNSHARSSTIGYRVRVGSLTSM